MVVLICSYYIITIVTIIIIIIIIIIITVTSHEQHGALHDRSIEFVQQFSPTNIKETSNVMKTAGGFPSQCASNMGYFMMLSILTHLPLVPHICVSELGKQLFR